jgi:thymidylate kinase
LCNKKIKWNFVLKRKSTRDDNDQWDLADAEAYNSKLEHYREQLNSRNAKVIELNTSCSIEEVYKMIDEQVLPLI